MEMRKVIKKVLLGERLLKPLPGNGLNWKKIVKLRNENVAVNFCAWKFQIDQSQSSSKSVVNFYPTFYPIYIFHENYWLRHAGSRGHGFISRNLLNSINIDSESSYYDKFNLKIQL